MPSLFAMVFAGAMSPSGPSEKSRDVRVKSAMRAKDAVARPLPKELQLKAFEMMSLHRPSKSCSDSERLHLNASLPEQECGE